MDLYPDSRHDLFLGWKRGRDAAHLYDQATYGLIDVLQPYAITDWPLTDAEIQKILREGMQLPNTSMLNVPMEFVPPEADNRRQ